MGMRFLVKAVIAIFFIKPIERFMKNYNSIVQIKNQNQENLLKNEGVTAVDIGYKIKKGTLSKEVVIRVFVENKLGVGELEKRSIEPIPKSIEGIPIDIVGENSFITRPINWQSKFSEWDQWEDILELIKEGKCILMLGPDVSTSPTEDNKPYVDLFAEYLSGYLRGENLSQSSFSEVSAIYKGKKSSSHLRNKINNFYKKDLEPCKSFEYISKLPFPLIINTSPDHLLKEAYQKTVLFDYYNFRDNRKEVQSSGTPEIPLIYNLFGSAVEPNSLVITEKDRLDFLINSIKKDPPLPEILLNEKINDIDNIFLFIGFDFNEWYLRLLLNTLSLDNDQFSCAIDRHDIEPNNSARVFYTQNFKMEFFNAPADIFIEELYKRFRKKYPPKKILVPKQQDISKKTPSCVILASNADKSFVVEFELMMQPLTLKKRIEIWDSNKIKSGNEQQQLKQKIQESDIIVLCLTADIFESFHGDHNILQVMEEHLNTNPNVSIVPVVYKDCLYAEYDFVKNNKIFPIKDEKITPVSSWNESADAFKQIADSINQIIESK